MGRQPPASTCNTSNTPAHMHHQHEKLTPHTTNTAHAQNTELLKISLVIISPHNYIVTINF